MQNIPARALALASVTASALELASASAIRKHCETIGSKCNLKCLPALEWALALATASAPRWQAAAMASVAESVAVASVEELVLVSEVVSVLESA